MATVDHCWVLTTKKVSSAAFIGKKSPWTLFNRKFRHKSKVCPPNCIVHFNFSNQTHSIQCNEFIIFLFKEKSRVVAELLIPYNNLLWVYFASWHGLFSVVYSLACSVNWSSSLFMLFLDSFFHSIIRGVCEFVWNERNKTFGEMRCYATRLYVCMRAVSLIVNCLCSIKKESISIGTNRVFGHFKMNNKKPITVTQTSQREQLEYWSSENYSEWRIKKPPKKINFIDEIMSNYFMILLLNI